MNEEFQCFHAQEKMVLKIWSNFKYGNQSNQKDNISHAT
jgi:hypothetical protein